MDRMLALWKIANGKKTITGLIMLIPQILTFLGYIEWSGTAQQIINILTAAGVFTASVGAGHKIVKAKGK